MAAEELSAVASTLRARVPSDGTWIIQQKEEGTQFFFSETEDSAESRNLIKQAEALVKALARDSNRRLMSSDLPLLRWLVQRGRMAEGFESMVAALGRLHEAAVEQGEGSTAPPSPSLDGHQPQTPPPPQQQGQMEGTVSLGGVGGIRDRLLIMFFFMSFWFKSQL